MGRILSKDKRRSSSEESALISSKTPSIKDGNWGFRQRRVSRKHPTMGPGFGQTDGLPTLRPLCHPTVTLGFGWLISDGGLGGKGTEQGAGRSWRLAENKRRGPGIISHITRSALDSWPTIGVGSVPRYTRDQLPGGHASLGPGPLMDKGHRRVVQGKQLYSQCNVGFEIPLPQN